MPRCPPTSAARIDADMRETLLAELAALDEQRARLPQKRGRLILEEAKARLTQAGVADVSHQLRNGDLVETVAGAARPTPTSS